MIPDIGSCDRQPADEGLIDRVAVSFGERRQGHHVERRHQPLGIGIPAHDDRARGRRESERHDVTRGGAHKRYSGPGKRGPHHIHRREEIWEVFEPVRTPHETDYDVSIVETQLGARAFTLEWPVIPLRWWDPVGYQ